MNQQQFDQVSQLLSQVENLDIKKKINEVYASHPNIKEVPISQLKVSEFLRMFNRVSRQLRTELESDMGKLLPFQYNFQNEFGNGNLQNDLSHLFSHINAGQFPQAEGFLLRLAHYQVAHGFYEKSSSKVHNLRGINIQGLLDEQELMAEKLLKNSEQIEGLIEELAGAKSSLESFKSQKEKELTQITQNQQSSNQETQQISALLNQSTELKTKIEAMQEKYSENLEGVETSFKEHENNFATYKKAVDQLIATVQQKIDEYAKHLKFVEGKREFFEERNQYLKDLIGREVGVSLFETFKQRKLELKPRVDFWTKAVPIAAVTTIIGIYAIFSGFFGLVEHPDNLEGWQLMAVNSLKALPLMFLLYFSIRQYSVERNFKEEYAFKSAVALTIVAFRDQLDSKNNQDALILSSVDKIYDSPVQLKDRRKIKFAGNEDLISSLKNFSESIKNTTKTINGGKE